MAMVPWGPLFGHDILCATRIAYGFMRDLLFFLRGEVLLSCRELWLQVGFKVHVWAPKKYVEPPLETLAMFTVNTHIFFTEVNGHDSKMSPGKN